MDEPPTKEPRSSQGEGLLNSANNIGDSARKVLNLLDMSQEGLFLCVLKRKQMSGTSPTWSPLHDAFPQADCERDSHLPDWRSSMHLESKQLFPPYDSRAVVSRLSVKGQIVNVLGFGGRVQSLSPLLNCTVTARAAMENVQMNGRGCIPVKLLDTEMWMSYNVHM